MPISQESNIQVAISAYKSKNKNEVQTAKVFGVSETTLREHLKESHTQKHMQIIIYYHLFKKCLLSSLEIQINRYFQFIRNFYIK